MDTPQPKGMTLTQALTVFGTTSVVFGGIGWIHGFPGEPTVSQAAVQLFLFTLPVGVVMSLLLESFVGKYPICKYGRIYYVLHASIFIHFQSEVTSPSYFPLTIFINRGLIIVVIGIITVATILQLVGDRGKTPALYQVAIIFHFLFTMIVMIEWF